MPLFTRDPERDRYYLLPGMGGRAVRRKQRAALLWALAIGLVVSGGMAAVFYLIATSGPK
jgi:hypothetical protein